MKSEDKRLERLYDYTKFHIGIYLSAAAGLTTLISAASANSSELSFLDTLTHPHWILAVALLLMVIAGAAGAVVATSAIKSSSYDDFATSPQGAYGWVPWPGERWATIEHAAFWLSLTVVGVTLLSSSQVLSWLADLRPSPPINSKQPMLGNHTMSADDWKTLIDAATFFGAAIAFFVGLKQYRRGQQWKRAEFLAREMKELFSDVKCNNALMMIDWAEREIPLGAFLMPPDPTPVAVTYQQQSQALRPHTYSGSANSDCEAAQISSGSSVDGNYQFGGDETRIRDCYDGLLDRLDRIGGHLSRNLVTMDELRPYIGYYINDIAEAPSNTDEAIWGVSLLTYIIFYHFDGVAQLFSKNGTSIDPEGPVFRQYLDAVESQDANRATRLHSLACEEWSKLKGASPAFDK